MVSPSRGGGGGGGGRSFSNPSPLVTVARPILDRISPAISASIPFLPRIEEGAILRVIYRSPGR